MKSALLLSGGWEGHRPQTFAQLFASRLRDFGIETTCVDALDLLTDEKAVRGYDLLIPNWTMGALSPEQTAGLCNAVRGGVGLAGIHGGMGDAFRGNTEYEWMVGGHFVGHPHVGAYEVRICQPEHPVVATLPSAFSYDSEEYYLLVDPAVQVLAEADYPFEGRVVVMPVAWTKLWGAGRIFYSALGHEPGEFERCPEALDLALRGMAWAAGAL